LNIKLNTMLVNSCLFNDVFIPPCTNDSGLSLGAAACYHWFNNHAIQKLSPYINNYGIESLDSYSYTLEDIKMVADHVADNKIIAICNGYGEAGPRALGNRSIIARADSNRLAQKVSMDCKGREWYRPIAPIMLAKNVEYFTGVKSIPQISTYMLMEFDILSKHKNEIEGCTHVDNTSRIQTINDRKDNAFIYDLLMYLDEVHQIKCLINTSFNEKGFPIVHTYNDAVRSAKAMNLNGLVYQGKYHHYH
ncbi:MAG: nodulation protein NodU, partial [Bacteroidales bacterium]|nr:nodulation protein NodU [Bacteroidales bacterium]